MISKSDKQAAIERLQKWLKPGDQVYTILRHRSRSGTSRIIDLVFPFIDERTGKVEIRCLGYNTAAAIELTFDREREGIKISGCGQDMGYWLVHALGSVLWPDGFKTWPGYMRNGPIEFDPCGGYALKHCWM